jgi:two-component system cell cycle sensor histidine kinase/response regulator CckA
MVYGVAKQSGGHISVYSEIGHGTVFKLYLPVTAGSLDAVVREAPALPVLGTETVLLVEDDTQFRMIGKLFLEASGYKVHEAANGSEALRMVETAGVAFQLLVTDVVMPGMSGRELADQVRALRPGIKVLYMSGYADDAMLRHGLERGKFPFIQKPFSLRDFGLKVREALGGG